MWKLWKTHMWVSCHATPSRSQRDRVVIRAWLGQTATRSRFQSRVEDEISFHLHASSQVGRPRVDVDVQDSSKYDHGLTSLG